MDPDKIKAKRKISAPDLNPDLALDLTPTGAPAVENAIGQMAAELQAAGPAVVAFNSLSPRQKEEIEKNPRRLLTPSKLDLVPGLREVREILTPGHRIPGAMGAATLSCTILYVIDKLSKR